MQAGNYTAVQCYSYKVLGPQCHAVFVHCFALLVVLLMLRMLFESNVRCTIHGPSFATLWYMYMKVQTRDMFAYCNIADDDNENNKDHK